jgi:hypothetical protein
VNQQPFTLSKVRPGEKVEQSLVFGVVVGVVFWAEKMASSTNLDVVLEDDKSTAALSGVTDSTCAVGVGF